MSRPGMTTASGLSESRAIAVTQQASVMEELQTLTPDQLAAYRPPTATGLGSTETVTVSCANSAGAWLTFPLAAGVLDTLPNPLTVRCDITWTDTRGYRFTKSVSKQFYR